LGSVGSVGSEKMAGVIDCEDLNWRAVLNGILLAGMEADLINFDYHRHATFCEMIAEMYGMNFEPESDPKLNTAYLRQRTSN